MYACKRVCVICHANSAVGVRYIFEPRTPRQQCAAHTTNHRRKASVSDRHTTDRSVAATPTKMPVLQYAQWLCDKAIDRIQRVLLGVLRAGPIPQHVAFVMDGNRRYARTKGMKVIQGHVDGFVALRRVCPTHISRFKLCDIQITGVGDMLNPRRQGRLCVRLCHRQLQSPERGGGRAHELSRKSTLGTLLAWVRRHFRSPRSGVVNIAWQGNPLRARSTVKYRRKNPALSA
jgi:hypothetical protein